MDGNNKENERPVGNTGNKKKIRYRKKSNSSGEDVNKPKLTREMKFHMHDAS